MEEQMKSNIESHMDTILSRTDIMYDAMYELVLNANQEAESLRGDANEISRYSKNKAVAISENLSLICNNSVLKDYIDKLMIIYTEDFFIQRGAIYGSMDDVKHILESEWFASESQKSLMDYHLSIVDSPFFEANGKKMLPIQLNSGKSAMIFLGISNQLYNDILKEYGNDNGLMIFTEEGDVVALQGVEKEEAAYVWNLYMENKEDTIAFRLNENKKYAYYEQNAKSGLVICEVLDWEELMNERIVGMKVIIELFFAILLLWLVLFAVLSYQIDKPVQKLIRRIQIISNGNFERDPEIEGEDEMGQIGRVINQMSEKIERMKKEEIQSEQEKRELEIRMLQAQINPHFLYNTLDSVKWVAAIQENTSIEKVVTALIRLLQNMAKGYNEKVTLRQELEFLQDYIDVERFKYVELFDVKIEVADERLYDARIIRLLLQPVVENAIFNGIEPAKKVGKILIFVFQEEEKLVVTVSDNGIGMSEEKVKTLLLEEGEKRKDSLNGIGLKNIDKRIQLVYGETAGLEIESTVGTGTKVTIRLPLEF